MHFRAKKDFGQLSSTLLSPHSLKCLQETEHVEKKHLWVLFIQLRIINATVTLGRVQTHTCSDVKAMSLGTAAIPFSLTSGNIL